MTLFTENLKWSYGLVGQFGSSTLAHTCKHRDFFLTPCLVEITVSGWNLQFSTNNMCSYYYYSFVFFVGRGVYIYIYIYNIYCLCSPPHLPLSPVFDAHCVFGGLKRILLGSTSLVPTSLHQDPCCLCLYLPHSWSCTKFWSQTRACNIFAI